MLRKSIAASAAAVLLVGLVLAADREVPGKIVKYDPKTREVTLQTSAGKEDFKLGADCTVVDARGAESKDGLTDRRLTAGADVTLFIPDRAKTVKEVRLGAPKIAGGKVAQKTDAKAPPKAETKTAAKAPPKEEPKAPARPDLEKIRASREKGTKATVVSVDVDKGTAVVTVDGRRTTITIGEDVVFYGPLGGESDRKIKDDRFAAGSEIVIVYAGTGRTVKEIHLPYRRTEDDKTGKAAEKKKAG
jgi:hypothetical protein